MSTTFTRVAKVLVTNVQAVNTGTDKLSAAEGDVFLFDRGFNVVGDTATVQTGADNEIIYVGLGIAGGGLETSMPIQTKNVRLVKRSAYLAPVPMSVTISSINAANSTEYAVKIMYRDQFTTAPGQSAPRTYLFTSDASATAAEIATGLAARINADKTADVTATVSTNDLVITAKTIAARAIDTYQRTTFDVSLPLGFNTDTVVKTVSGGSEGQGHGQKVKDLEQSTKNVQRIQFPIPTETTKASNTGTYNLVTVEHYHEHVGDMLNQRKEPLKTVVAFAVTPVATTAGAALSAGTSLTVASGSGIVVGQLITSVASGVTIPVGTTVTAVSGTTITLSAASTIPDTSAVIFVGSLKEKAFLTKLSSVIESAGTFVS